MPSPQKDLLKAIAERVNTGDVKGAEALFSDDFMLHDPNAPDWPRGREGARRMFAAFHGIKIEPQDMIEEGDRVCVRWAFSGVRDGVPITASCVAIYRFENNLIAEDWGVTARAPWA
jgi:predicted SnoaL-like aldol condensation-catalyzing enzyme